ncbi:hypothetical protein V3C99_003620 [Haemonchus contortus]|uniref:C3H1-type domain-containing protein n=1 Tax=Haemonchus contortus TaxID=6289 RepID=A0A6F7P019_HAECO
MAEELNCDLDEGSHHDGSDGGSKSSAEDAQEHANDSKQTFQPPPEKVEDVLDLDYDEGSPNGNQERAEDGEESSDGEIKDSSDENKSNAANGDKEEGEIDDSDEDDGEIEVDVERTRKVPIEARLSRPSAPVRDRCVKVRECPYEINGSCTWGPDCKYIHRNKEPLRLFSRGKVAEETSWERGLREAREAMRRASKKRQEPEFETKRLNAAPTGERTRTVHDSDSDDVSSPHRRSPHSSRQHIPSLLEIATLPPRFPSRSSSHKDGVRSATRGSPCYSDDDDTLPSRHNRTDSGRGRDGGSYRERREIKDLGPQVRYPCGRPPPPARGDRRSGGDGNSQRHSSSRQEKVKESAPRSRRESPHSSSSTKARSRTGRISPSLDASPISSDSSLSPARSPRKTANPTHTDKNVDKKVKKKVQSGSAMGDVTDPWARKKKATSWTKNNNEPKTRGRSSSNSTSSSSNSHEKLRRAAAANLNRNSRLPCSPPVAKVERRLSPPRGDIAGFRIPKKHRAVSSRDRTYSSGRGNCDSGRDVAFSKKSNVESHSSKRSESKKNREPCKLSDDEMEQTIDSRGAENISDSESAQSVSRSSSVMSSSSSQGSSQSRSASPALPAKYRVPGGKEDAAPASVEKTVASVSDSEGESKKKNRSKGASKGKRAGASPHLREISPSPSPPPPPPPPDDANSRRRQRDKSETPPPPPPPLPLINEFVLERQARKGKSIAEKRSSTEKSKRERSPPKKKAKGNHDGLTDKERRKRELMEQLRAVEEELKKRTAATSAL